MRALLFLFALLFSCVSNSLEDGVWVPLVYVELKRTSKDILNDPILALLVRGGKISIQSRYTDYLPVTSIQKGDYYELSDIVFHPDLEEVYSGTAQLRSSGNLLELYLDMHAGGQKVISLVSGINDNIKFSFNFQKQLAILALLGTYNLYRSSGLLLEEDIEFTIDGRILSSTRWSSFVIEKSGVQLRNEQRYQQVFYDKVSIIHDTGESKSYVFLDVLDGLLNIYSYRSKHGYDIEPIQLEYYLKRN